MAKKEVTPSDDDYCGPNGLHTGPNDPIARACQVHDWRYEQHHIDPEAAYIRGEIADKEFARNVDRLIEGQEFLAGRPLPLRRAWGYFCKKMVNIFGRFWWR